MLRNIILQLSSPIVFFTRANEMSSSVATLLRARAGLVALVDIHAASTVLVELVTVVAVALMTSGRHETLVATIVLRTAASNVAAVRAFVVAGGTVLLMIAHLAVRDARTVRALVQAVCVHTCLRVVSTFNKVVF